MRECASYMTGSNHCNFRWRRLKKYIDMIGNPNAVMTVADLTTTTEDNIRIGIIDNAIIRVVERIAELLRSRGGKSFIPIHGFVTMH